MEGVDKGLVTEWVPKKDLRLIRFIYKYLSEDVLKRDFHSILQRFSVSEKSLPSIEVMAVCLKELEFYIWSDSKQLRRLGTGLSSFDREADFLEGKRTDGREMVFPELNKANDAKLKQFFRTAFYMSCLSDSDFEWIDTCDDRQCYYVWGAIRLMRENPKSSDVYFKPVGSYCGRFDNFFLSEFERGSDDKNERIKYSFEKYCNDLNTSDNQKKKSKIIEFFDLMDGDLERKKALNDFLKSEWEDRAKNVALMSWLRKNEELSIWAYNYILKTHFDGIPPNWMQVHGVNDTKYSLSCRAAVMALFDLLPDKRQQQNFLDKMRRSGRQQKAREKLKRIKSGKSENSINISKNVYDKLKVIAQLQDDKKEDVVERFINDAYAKLKEKSISGG